MSKNKIITLDNTEDVLTQEAPKTKQAIVDSFTQTPEKEQPVGFAYSPDADIPVTFKGHQFAGFMALVKLFENPIAQINNIHKGMIESGISRPVFMKDLDSNGNIKPEFFKK